MSAVRDEIGRYSTALRHLGEYRRAGGGLTFHCPLKARHRNGDANPSGRAWVGRDGNLMLRCRGCGAGWAELTRALGIDPRDCSTRGRAYRMGDVGPKPVLVATYQYRAHDGTLLYEKQRYEPGRDGRRKDFVARRPLPASWRKRLNCPPSQEAWVYGLGAGEYGRPAKPVPVWWFRQPVQDTWLEVIQVDSVDPVLYRLPELAAAPPAAPVFVVEGEGDVEALRALGFTATCGHAGANTWLPHWSPEFRGRRVVVVPDHNVVGYQHADRVAGAVLRAGAASVRVPSWADAAVDGPCPGLGGGVKNWFDLLDAHPGNGGQVSAAARKAAVIEFVKGAVEYAGTPVH